MATRMRMRNHIHTVYVKQTVEQIVKKLNRNNIKARLSAKQKDPTDVMAYVGEQSGVSSCAYFRKRSKELGLPEGFDAPEGSKACFEINSTAKDFHQLVTAIKKHFTIIKDCTVCTPVGHVPARPR